jgi:hypothetical protein
MSASDDGARGWRDVISEVLDYTPFPDLRKGLRQSWQSPPRAGVNRVIAPWAYRHLRFYGTGHTAGGMVGAAAGLICLAYGANGWAAFFLAIAALNLAGGTWYLSIARSASAQA